MAPDLRFRGCPGGVVAAVEAVKSRGDHPLNHPLATPRCSQPSAKRRLRPVGLNPCNNAP